MFLLWKYFALTFSALFPLVNPVGSALVFLSLVGPAPITVYRSLSRRIAINTILFLVIVDLIGSTLLRFFGISLPIVQFAGGFVIAAIAWSMLNQKDSGAGDDKMQAAADAESDKAAGKLLEKTFYPFTFPITVGPGCIVVILTLGAHVPQANLSGTVLSHVGFLIAILALSATVYYSYAYAPRLAQKISPATAHGILRVISFILFCIGVQIAWNGLATLLTSVIHKT